MPKRKIILIIMDGWGLGKIKASDAIQNAEVPFIQSLYNHYPHTTLTTCGEAVGLPEGQMGNSEVGHLNLGAGRVVYQELQRINVAIREGMFQQNKQLLTMMHFALENKKPLHLIGLVSNGGVHSHINHLKALLSLCKEHSVTEVYVHAFTDGRDCDPKSGLAFITELQEHMDKTVGSIATVSGRYFAMDRDNRWDRVKLAYDAMVKGTGEQASSAVEAVTQSYTRDITDEFIKPTIIIKGGQPVKTIKNDDVGLCFNFRTDRCREITKALTQADFPEYDMHKLSLYYTTLTDYDSSFENIHVVFSNDNLTNTLGEVLEQNNMKQIRIAETEKYPHVTFFFSGGRETTFAGEKRILIPSPKVATYNLQPEMSAYELTESLLPDIESGTPDFVCLNYANADMVGHTGIWEAVIKAVETVNNCVEKIVTVGLKNNYTILLTADHGNADYMINDDGSPNTAHSLNPVPLFIISNDWKGKLDKGKLADIAPTILQMMGVPIPIEMSGNILTEPG